MNNNNLMSAKRFTTLDVVVVALVILIGAVHLSYGFDGDQALFTLGASKMSRGAVLYRDFWDLKQPGIFGFYLVAGKLFGFSEVGIHLLELLYMAGLSVVLIVTLRGYFKSRAVASLLPLLTVGIYYGVSGSWHLTQVEGLVGFPMFLSLWFASLSSKREGGRRIAYLALSGFMGGVVLLFKFFFLPIVLAFWTATLLDAVMRKRERFLPAIARVGLPIALGAVVPLGLVFIYFAQLETMSVLKYTFFEYPARALSELPPRHIGGLIKGMLWFLASFTPLTALAFIWAWTSFQRGRKVLQAELLTINLVLWLIFGLVVIVLQRLSWWEYHYLLLFVPLGILAAKGLDVLWDRLSEVHPSLTSKRGRVAVVLSVALLFSPALGSLATKTLLFARWRFPLGREQRREYQSETFGNYKTIIADVAFLSEPDTLPGGIFIFGNPLYYYLSDRDQAVASNGWMPELFLKEQWEQLNTQLDKALPSYIFVAPEYIELIPTRSLETARFIDAHYGAFSITPNGRWYLLKPEFQAAKTGLRVIEVTVEGGYEPDVIVVKAGQPVRLNFTRREASRCGEEVVIPDFNKQAVLPQNKTVGIMLTPEEPGEYEFTCGMNMMRGKLIVEPK